MWRRRRRLRPTPARISGRKIKALSSARREAGAFVFHLAEGSSEPAGEGSPARLTDPDVEPASRSVAESRESPRTIQITRFGRSMSLQSVKSWLAEHAPELAIIEVEGTTATVETAAVALNVEPGRIAKTLAVRAGNHLFLLCTRGNARLDNRKCKDEFGDRPRMLGPDETLELTGHPVGGVCPFGLKTPLPVYLDVSLQAFDVVYPAGGSLNTSVEVPTGRLFDLVAERWVDLCKLPEAAGA